MGLNHFRAQHFGSKQFAPISGFFSAVGGQIKVFLGAWVAKPVKVWLGAWVVKKIKFYDGTTWRETNY